MKMAQIPAIKEPCGKMARWYHNPAVVEQQSAVMGRQSRTRTYADAHASNSAIQLC